MGWIPTQYNINKETKEQTSPKLTEDSFSSIKEDTGKLLARRAILVHRRRQIENYKDPENKGFLSFIRDDGRIPAEGIVCATPTGRTTHRKIVNIPKASDKVILGKEMRSLFIVPYGYKMIGADLKAIETRMIGHSAWPFDNGDYWNVINSVDDIHDYNAKLISNTRDIAKSFQYAIFFGAMAAKLASIIGCSIKEAEGFIESFWSGNKGIKDLIDFLKKFYKKHKFIVGLDNRKLQLRAEYRALNLLIQSAAAIIFKRWCVIANKELYKRGLDCTQILAFHDELQYRCIEVDVEESCQVILDSARLAGEYYKLTVPILADCKVGMNWAETH